MVNPYGPPPPSNDEEGGFVDFIEELGNFLAYSKDTENPYYEHQPHQPPPPLQHPPPYPHLPPPYRGPPPMKKDVLKKVITDLRDYVGSPKVKGQRSKQRTIERVIQELEVSSKIKVPFN